jgi:two-component SAPR family response regulator
METRSDMPESNTLSGKRILVVEDDLLQALDLATMLESAGAKVVGPAATLDEAIRLLTETGCDGVILDLRVGEHNATSFARQLVKDGVPFVVQTGYPNSIFLKTDWPGCRVILKPVQQDELMLILEDILNWNTIPNRQDDQ